MSDHAPSPYAEPHRCIRWDGLPSGDATCSDPTAPCAAGRGSHSIDWFTSRISDIEERDRCPNVHSVDSWYACASVAECAQEDTAISARAMRKVLMLRCIDRSPYVRNFCTRGDEYHLKSFTYYGGGLSIGCFVRAGGGAQPPLCTPPIWREDASLLFAPGLLLWRFERAHPLSFKPTSLTRSLLFAPVDAETRRDDADVCGFYFLPYRIFRDVAAAYGSTYATDLDIRWPDAAYAGAPKHRPARVAYVSDF